MTMDMATRGVATLQEGERGRVGEYDYRVRVHSDAIRMKLGWQVANLSASPGMKFDGGKMRYDLVDPDTEAEEVAVLMFGAVKYEEENWRLVPDAKKRYYAALRRHVAAYMRGEEFDLETGLHHLGHALCCARFLLGVRMQEEPAIAATLPVRLEQAVTKARELRGRRGA